MPAAVRWEWRICHPRAARTRLIRTNKRARAAAEALRVLLTLAPGTRAVVSEVFFGVGPAGRRTYTRVPRARFLRTPDAIVECDPITGAVPESAAVLAAEYPAPVPRHPYLDAEFT